MVAYTSTQLAQLAAAEDEFGDAFEKWLEAQEYATGRDVMSEEMDIDGLFQDFREHYRGQWKDEEEYARYAIIDQGVGWCGVGHEEISELRAYINWDLVARDFFNGGYTFLDGHVFEDEI